MKKLILWPALLMALVWQCWAVEPYALFTVKGTVGHRDAHINLKDTLTKQFVDSAIADLLGSFSMTFSEVPRSITTWILTGTRYPDCDIQDTLISVPLSSLKGGSGSYLGADTVTINPRMNCRLLSKNPLVNDASQTLGMKVRRVSNGAIETEYILPTLGQISMAVYGVDGRLMKTFFNRNESAGKHAASLEISGLPAGIYFLKLQTYTNVALVKVSIER